MTERHYFVSDTHFCQSRPQHIDAFGLFCKKINRGDSLILLGDIFEVWMGDDIIGRAERYVSDILQALTARGVNTYFMQGNRDFLVGHAFCKRIGMTLLHDPTVWTLPSQQRVLLTHGDSFCLHDKAYKRFRSITRNRVVQWLFFRLSKHRRQRIASYLRNKSKGNAKRKNDYLMDVSPPLVANWLTQYDVNALVMGHTHRPNLHREGLAQRLVLGDWHHCAWYAESDDTGLSLYECNFDFSEIHRRHYMTL